MAATVLDLRDGPPDSVGRPWGNTEIRIANNDTTVPRDSPGEIYLRYPGQLRPMPWPDCDRGASFSDLDWIPTGDVGWCDDAGHLHLTGRSDDLVNRGGRLVSTERIADTIRDIPMVTDAAAVTIEDRALGVDIAAIVVVAADDWAEVRGQIANRLKPWELPTIVRNVDAIPRTRTGKLDRRAARELALTAKRGV
jgi:acyl-CoA synthetase (AMP-forming)/AMP-acid ligase II